MPARTPFRTLLALRYKLIWAQARTSTGRIALLFVLYALGALVFAFLALGGVGTAIAAVRFGRGEIVVTGVLGALFAAAIPTTLFLSVGPTTAFSDRVMRRFPLTSRTRFLVRHFIGLLDPLWLLYFGTLLGLAAGLQIVGACSIFVSLPTLLAYLAVIYLIVAVLVSLVSKVLETRVGPLLLMIAGMSVYLLAAFGLPMAARHGAHLAREGLVALQFTPAAAAGHVLMGANVVVRLAGAGLLVVWGLAFAALLQGVEPLRFARRHDSAAAATGESWYDALGDCFGPEVGPLFAKALRYHLRCNRVRYSLGVSAPVFVAILYMQRLSPAERTFGLLMELAIIGFIATFAMSVNYFGWDGPGLRRYRLLPAPAGAALRAYSYAGMALGATVALVVFAFVLATSGLPRTWDLVIFAAAGALAGLLWLHVAGMWLSVLAPKLTDFDSMMSGNVSRAATLLMVGMIVPLLLALKLWIHRPAQVIAYWWVVALLAVLGAVAYRISLRAAGRALSRRWERIAGDLSAKSGSFAAAG